MINLVVFLGNYGHRYSGNRHNVAWQFADNLPFAHKLSWQSKFKGQYATLDDLCSERVYFLKPETYMNLSGESIGELSRFFKISAEQILVVHDELELPVGTISLKKGGGLGGHNGLRSAKAVLGTADFWRLRFGIGRPQHDDVAGYVLSDFTADEKIIFQQIFPQAAELLEQIFSDNPDKLLSKWNKKNLLL
ncbi:MAG: aminoacyl-tRNA hydrolase [Spirochaetaceae bacterium]|nr:aminoacyl-tRNA hydrolase [Spirochaetaceae bacterium]